MGSETDREKRSALKEGIEALSNKAVWLGSENGPTREVVTGRVTDVKSIVDAEIRERRSDDGRLMIEACLERALGGYAEEFYDWVEP